MNGNCHLLFGITCGTAIAVNLDKIQAVFPCLCNTPEMATLFVLGGAVGGIFPDIDNPKSYMGKLTVPVSTVIGEIGACFGKKDSNHRGILHDPIVYILGLWLSYEFCPALVGLFFGALTHLYLDMFNPSGVPFLLGFTKIRLASIKSGSRGSTIFTWINIAIIILITIVVKTNVIFL